MKIDLTMTVDDGTNTRTTNRTIDLATANRANLKIFLRRFVSEVIFEGYRRLRVQEGKNWTR